MIKPFPHYRQPDSKDCGPTCLRIVAKYYGKIQGNLIRFEYTALS
jgi:ABC-type bacteriocin/lantibiotic exporter with double-glycine peptidase domain